MGVGTRCATPVQQRARAPAPSHVARFRQSLVILRRRKHDGARRQRVRGDRGKAGACTERRPISRPGQVTKPCNESHNPGRKAGAFGIYVVLSEITVSGP